MSSTAEAFALPRDQWPDVSHIVTEDDTPVDNFMSEKQQRLLTEPLYASWLGPPPLPDTVGTAQKRTFVAAANVGVFFRIKESPIVPDVMLSLDVELAKNLWEQENRTYFVWEIGKPPDIVIEIVSNRQGGELEAKRGKYARMGVPYYVVWDPQGLYGEPTLRAFAKHGLAFYMPMKTLAFLDVGLSLVLWEGVFEEVHNIWLRWADLDGNLILTGAESAAAERKRAEDERKRADDADKRADDERKRADAAQARANRLAEKLRALGIDPNGDG